MKHVTHEVCTEVAVLQIDAQRPWSTSIRSRRRRTCGAEIASLVLFLAAHSLIGAAIPDSPLNTGAPEHAWAIREVGADHRVWKNETTVMTENGPVTETRSFVEMASGLYYWRDNQWNESRDEIEIVPTGAAATKGQHQVHFAANANTLGAVTLTTPSGTLLQTHVSALAYTDESTGQSVLLAIMQDSTGLLLPPNQVLYPNAFAGVRGDIRYTYTKGAFEQDVILRENPPSPSEYGMNPRTTRLEVWTEFVNVADPEKFHSVEVDGMGDDWLDFVGLRMGRGHAFSDGAANRLAGTSVSKNWVKEDNRSFLVEAVRYPSVELELANLPPLQANLRQARHNRTAFVRAAVRPPRIERKDERIQMAKLEARKQDGFVLDYVAYPAGNQTNVTFRADTTYLISGVANLWKTTTFEGGTVIKYVATNSAQLQAFSNVVFKTSAYRPAIFTSRNDRSVGEDIYLAGAVTNYPQMLSCGVMPLEVKNIRVSYATIGLHTFGVNLYDAVFTHCGIATYLEFNACDVNNVLFYNCSNAFGGARYKITARQITADRVTSLTSDYSSNPSTNWIVFTNSLFSQITSNGVVPTTNWYSATDDGANVFQRVGAGSHYLAEDSLYRSAGTSEIPEGLATNLTLRTTYPPVFWTDAITNDTTFEPVVERFSDYPDLGYYYPALDYLLTSIIVTNAELMLMPGTAVGVYGTNGITVQYGGTLMSQGCPAETERNHFVPFYAVQEESTNLLGGTLVSSNTFFASRDDGTLKLHFTDLDGVAGFGRHIFGNSSNQSFYRVTVRDCNFNAGALDLGGWWGGLWGFPEVHGFTNNIFYRVNATFSDNAALEFWNNYAFGSSSFRFLPGGITDWWVRDNLFHDGTYTNNNAGSSAWHQGYNAYLDVASADRLNPSNPNNITLGSGFYFTNGPLGKFYQKDNSALHNAGSRRATNAALYHYTTRQDQTLEAGSLVDIGFHYPAVNGEGMCFDSDEDGLADFIEDQNGNGTYEASAESNPADADSKVAGVRDNQLTVYFEMQTPEQSETFTGTNIVVGPGFRVWLAKKHVTDSPNGSLFFMFDRRHGANSLQTWTDDGPDPDVMAAWIYVLPASSAGIQKYFIAYDLHNLNIVVTNGNQQVATNPMKWRDNITEKFGDGKRKGFKPHLSYVQNAKWKKVIPIPHAKAKYVWDGVVGNTSKDQAGPTVHSTWWPKLKLVSRGTNIFSTGGYNERRWDIQRYTTAKPNVVFQNLSRSGRQSGSWPIDLRLADSDPNVLYAKYSDKLGNTVWVSFYAHTGAKITDGVLESQVPLPPSVGFTVPTGSAIALRPGDLDRAAVYDVTTEQVRVYDNARNSSPTLRFTIGLANGYANGPDVPRPEQNAQFSTDLKLGSYYFDFNQETSEAFPVSAPVVGFEENGKLWIGDAATGRLLRFNTTGSQGIWDGTIVQHVPHVYGACVDPNSPNNAKRVFAGYLEFEVNHSLALNNPNSWKLKRYWGFRTDGNVVDYRSPTQNGIWSVATLNTPSGQKTYATMWDPVQDTGDNQRRLVELVASGANKGIRVIPGATVRDFGSLSELEADGARVWRANGASSPAILMRSVMSWNANGDPQYTDHPISTNNFNTDDPLSRNDVQIRTNGSSIYAFQNSEVHTGWHLGGVSRGTAATSQWQWRNAESGQLDGKGKFATVEFFGSGGTAASVVNFMGNDIFYAFHGEFWKPEPGANAGQANQFMHHKSDGTFAGQFGLPRVDGSGDDRPGSAGNVHGFGLVKIGTTIYMYTGDEWSLGVHRWRIRKP